MTDAEPDQPASTAAPAEMVRLALVRYQLRAAGEQARVKAPLSSIALNTMQDAVESMLLIATGKTGAAAAERADFAQLFDAVVEKSHDAALIRSYRSRLLTMNKARVSFKHHGNRADDTTVQQHLATAEEFCDTLAKLEFGTRLDDVSMLAFVESSVVRSDLESAARDREAGSDAVSLVHLAIGFAKLLREFEDSKTDEDYGPSPYSTKPLGHRSSRPAGGIDLLGGVESWLESIDQQLRVLSMGIDPHEYAYFKAHTPVLHYHFGGEIGASFVGSPPLVTDVAFARMMEFVIDSAIHLSSIDYDLSERDLDAPAYVGLSDDGEVRVEPE